jgi:hypothetical protein
VVFVGAEILSQTPSDLLTSLRVEYTASQSNAIFKAGLNSSYTQGNANIRITVRDDGGTSDGGINQTTTEFSIKVNIEKNPPMLAKPEGEIRIAEDAYATQNNQLDIDLTGNFTIDVNVPIELILSDIVDPDDILQDEKADGIKITNGTKSTMSVFLRPNGFGEARIYYRAYANGLFSTNADVVTIFVSPVNDPPTFTVPSETTLKQGATQAVVRVTAINLGSRESAQSISNITVSIIKQTPFGLIPGNSTFEIASNQLSASLFIPINPSLYGDATLSVSIQDSGPDSDEGANSSSRDFHITVTAVDHPPFLSKPIGTTNLTRADVLALPNFTLNIPIEGHFTDPENDPITYFLYLLDDPQDILNNETPQGISFNTNNGISSLALSMKTNRTGVATIEYVAIAKGQISEKSDSLVISIIDAGPTFADINKLKKPKLIGSIVPGSEIMVSFDGAQPINLPIIWEIAHNDAGIGAIRLNTSLPIIIVPENTQGSFIRARFGSASTVFYLIGQEIQRFTDQYPAAMSLSSYSASDVINSIDTDGDGLTDVAEFALGLDPNSPDKIFLSPEKAITADGRQVIRWKYVEMRNRTEVQLILEFSTDLREWIPVTDGFFVSRETGYSRLCIIETPATEFRGFWRLRVQSRSSDQ